MYSVDLYRRVRRACHGEGMSDREAARHGYVGLEVTDFGCRSCGSWSHGFVMCGVVLGGEVSGFCPWDAGVLGVV